LRGTPGELRTADALLPVQWIVRLQLPSRVIHLKPSPQATREA
jgi:hypothetical protein